VDGRKATDRSWKTVYVVLKAKALYMYKDKKMAQENMEYEEKPVKLAESEVEVANDYTKRKNVFRVKTELGSEYLFQVISFFSGLLSVSDSDSHGNGSLRIDLALLDPDPTPV